MTIEQIFRILIARRRLVFAIFAGTVLIATALGLLLPKRYTATSQVIVDVKSPDPVLGVTLPVTPQGYIATQVDVIQSERVARYVAERLSRTLLAEEVSDWKSDTGGQGDFNAWFAEKMLKKLQVRPSRDSGVITIVYTDTNPKRASEIANGFAGVYIDTTLALRVDPARDSATFFDERIRGARQAVETAQLALSRYQRDHNILGLANPIDVESQRLSELVSQLSAIQATAGESRSRDSAANSRGNGSMPEVQSNMVIIGLKSDLARAEAKHKETAAKFGSSHPIYQSQEAEIESLKDRLATESSSIARAITTNNVVNTQRESQVKAALDAQREKVLQLKENYDQLATMQREVEFARKQYDTVSQRYTTTLLESQSRSTNVALLTPSIEPQEASFPKAVPFMATGGVLGIVLSVLLTLLVEMRRPLVRGASNVFDDLQLPVFGELPNAESRSRISMLPWSPSGDGPLRLPLAGA